VSGTPLASPDPPMDEDRSPDPDDESTPALEERSAEDWARLEEAAQRSETLASQLSNQLAAIEDKVKRVQADFLNDTRRIRQQAEADRSFAIQRVVVDLLPLADALHLAGASQPAESPEGSRAEAPEVARLREGIDLLAKQFDEVLQRHGVERIEAAGLPFDPTRHEAVAVVDRDDVPPQTVVEVLRPGFLLNGRVVRPVHVVVSRAKGS
jgi:molecular chaperone GrpE